MSLICAVCRKFIVISDSKNHFGVCSSCPITIEAQKIIDNEDIYTGKITYRILKCNLCNAEFKCAESKGFSVEPQELFQRIKRHNDFHNIKIKHATSNINFGIPKYIWDEENI